MKAMECMAAMLLGATVGAVVALMFAPCDGKHMRKSVCKALKNTGLPYVDRLTCHCGEDCEVGEPEVESHAR